MKIYTLLPMSYANQNILPQLMYFISYFTERNYMWVYTYIKDKILVVKSGMQKLENGILKIIDVFWCFIYDLHLYETKQEGLFKAIIISISWYGGVNISESIEGVEFDNIVASTLYLFALAMIMECAIPWLSAKRFVKKIVPTLIVIPSIFVFVICSAQLLNRPSKNIPFTLLYNLTVFIQIVIWFDVLCQIMIEPPKYKMVSFIQELRDI